MRRTPPLSNHCFTRAWLPRPAACGRSSGTGQIRASNGSRCVFAYMNAHSMAFDLGRRGSRQQNGGIEVEKGGDDLAAIVQRRRTDHPILKIDAGFAEQPRPRAAASRRIAVRSPSTTARLTCSMTNTFHGASSATCAKSDFSNAFMKETRSMPRSMCLPSSGSSAIDRSSSSDATASRSKWRAAHERLVDGPEIAPVLIKSGANAVEVAERR